VETKGCKHKHCAICCHWGRRPYPGRCHSPGLDWKLHGFHVDGEFLALDVLAEDPVCDAAFLGEQIGSQERALAGKSRQWT